MIPPENLDQFGQSLQRIFAMKVTRSTYREVQNAVIAAVGGDQEKAQTLAECLLSRNTTSGPEGEPLPEPIQSIIQEYSVPIRLSKDVSEKGEFLSLVTSDTVRHGELVAFLNRVRRIDGEDFQFLTDTEGTLHLLLHVLSRLREVSSSEHGQKLLSQYQQHLNVIQTQVNALLTT